MDGMGICHGPVGLDGENLLGIVEDHVQHRRVEIGSKPVDQGGERAVHHHEALRERSGARHSAFVLPKLFDVCPRARRATKLPAL